MEDRPFLEASHISMTCPSKSGGLAVLDDVSFRLNRHEFVCIIGPSGAGKSTLLRILSGLLQQTSGELIYADGKEPDPRAIVFQNSNLLPWQRTIENIALPLMIHGTPRRRH